MFATVLLLLLSPAIGSFLALLADRLPRGEDVVRRRSFCRACGAGLGLRDLVPVLSFTLSAGRCRHCGAAIPPWLLYMEIGAVGAAVIAAILGQTPLEIWLFAAFLWVLLALLASDLMWFRLPDPLTGALFILALAIAWGTVRLSLSQALWGAVIGVAVFAALRWGYRALRGREGLGLGDVKLMAGLGAALGPHDLPLMLLLASLAALAAALAGRLQSPQSLRPTRPLPFGAALAAATMVLWVAS
ncbi:prepilin peptidase [Roseovarius faecimaris]|nr:A24 family peptidase [Roseovarius faecimaris]